MDDKSSAGIGGLRGIGRDHPHSDDGVVFNLRSAHAAAVLQDVGGPTLRGFATVLIGNGALVLH